VKDYYKEPVFEYEDPSNPLSTYKVWLVRRCVKMKQCEKCGAPKPEFRVCTYWRIIPLCRNCVKKWLPENVYREVLHFLEQEEKKKRKRRRKRR